jgi:superfamily II DNA or RNA helicase
MTGSKMFVPLGTLYKRGYKIKKSTLSKETLDDLKTELIVTPVEYMKDDSGVINSFGVYQEDEKNIYIPKYFAKKKYHSEHKMDESNINMGKNICIKSKIELREYQKPIADLLQESFDKIGGGILSLPCGRGKTVIAIDSIVKRKKKTLIIVHKEFLMNQWKRQLEKLTDAKVGIIQRNKVVVEGMDVVMCMLKSVSVRDYDPKIFEDFGYVIVDECHHIAAKVYSQALPKISCKYTLGLSATPERADKLHKIFHWYLGPMIYQEKVQMVDSVKARIFKFKIDHHLFKQINHYKNRKPLVETMVSNLVEIKERNDLITLLINERRYRGTRCQIMVLSRRREHLKLIKKQIDETIEHDRNIYKKLNKAHKILIKCLNNLHEEYKITKESFLKKQINALTIEITEQEKILEIYEKCAFHVTDYYVGGMKEQKLAIAEKADILFGTYDMAQEGLDIPTLNTILYSTGRSDVVQSTGRITRLADYEIPPEVIDIVDQLSTFINKGEKREKFYKSAAFNIYYYDVEFVYTDPLGDPRLATDKKQIEIANYKLILKKYLCSADAKKQSNYSDKPHTINFELEMISDDDYC